MAQKVSNDNAKKFQYVKDEVVACSGQSAPNDHPLVYLRIEDKKVVCPYCSSVYRMRK